MMMMTVDGNNGTCENLIKLNRKHFEQVKSGLLRLLSKMFKQNCLMLWQARTLLSANNLF